MELTRRYYETSNSLSLDIGRKILVFFKLLLTIRWVPKRYLSVSLPSPGGEGTSVGKLLGLVCDPNIARRLCHRLFVNYLPYYKD